MSNKIDEALIEAIGDAHESFSATTPLRADAFDKSDEEKIAIITEHVKGILETLGMDLEDDSLKGTPKRVAKLYVNEAFGGLHPKREPSMSTFENSYRYDEMLVEKNIVLYSTCEHHLLPIVGRAHVAYIPEKRVVGISKLARVVEAYAKRLQIQEKLTAQIANTVNEVLDAWNVARERDGWLKRWDREMAL